jgi:predicted amidohydrolase YtcJ
MRNWRTALLLAALPASAMAQAPADLVLRGGTVYTVSERQPTVEPIAVTGDRIVFVGSSAGVARWVGPRTRVVELGGRVVVPGLTDAHYHLLGVGEREVTLNLEGTRSLDELLTRVKARVSEARPGQWITGRGWIETRSTSPQFPSRQELDRVRLTIQSS